MKKHLLSLSIFACFFFVIVSCSRNSYKASNFEEKTEQHQVVAVLPAEMVFTGPQPKNMTEADINKLEEQESLDFQLALYNSILRHANTRKYITTINFQDITITQKKLSDAGIDVRSSWIMDDKDLAKALGVDAVVKMRVQKQRHMSDAASYGVDVAKQVITSIPIGRKLPMPSKVGKTHDIHAACKLVSNNVVLWNNNYRSATDWNTPANDVIAGIADNFGENFPYKRKRR
jgi:hypothetical protein